MLDITNHSQAQTRLSVPTFNMYALIGKCRKLGLPIDLQLELSDRMIVPIMLYGCEVWRPENYIETKKLHFKFLKLILWVHGRTTNNILYGELGRFSLEIQIKKG